MRGLLSRICLSRLVNVLQRFESGITQLAVKWHMASQGVRVYAPIPSYTHPGELCAMYRFIARRRVKSVIEVGSHLGKSLLFIAAAVGPKGHVFCIDTWRNNAMPGGRRDTYAEFQRNVRSMKSRITAIRIDADENPQVNTLPPKVDLVFIDADHRYQSVLRDIRVYSPFVRDGGYFVFHDFGAWSGVTMAVGDLLRTCKWRPEELFRSLLFLKREDLEDDWAKWNRLGCQ